MSKFSGAAKLVCHSLSSIHPLQGAAFSKGFMAKLYTARCCDTVEQLATRNALSATAIQGSGDRELGAGNWEQGTGTGLGQGTGDRELGQGTGRRRGLRGGLKGGLKGGLEGGA